MNRTILKSAWPAFVHANQIEENYSMMFRYLGNVRFEVTIFDSNDIRGGFHLTAQGSLLTVGNKYCNLKAGISKVSKHQGIIFFYLIGINKCGPSRLEACSVHLLQNSDII